MFKETWRGCSFLNNQHVNEVEFSINTEKQINIEEYIILAPKVIFDIWPEN